MCSTSSLPFLASIRGAKSYSLFFPSLLARRRNPPAVERSAFDPVFDNDFFLPLPFSPQTISLSRRMSHSCNDDPPPFSFPPSPRLKHAGWKGDSFRSSKERTFFPSLLYRPGPFPIFGARSTYWAPPPAREKKPSREAGLQGKPFSPLPPPPFTQFGTLHVGTKFFSFPRAQRILLTK